MTVAIVGSPKLDFHQFDAVIPRAARHIITDGSGLVEKNARIFADANNLKYTSHSSPKQHDRAEMLVRLMERADMVILLLDTENIEPESALESVVFPKPVVSYFVKNNYLCTLLPYPFPK